MHEASLVQSLLDQVQTLMRDHQAQRVQTIQLSVGEFSGVEPELLLAAYDVMVEDTPMRGARLKLCTIPLRAECQDCGEVFAVLQHRFQCPACDSSRTRITQGDELVLDSVTMESDSEW
jgi:hydrogenase nickel incorporation protein HypA/HybF